MYACVCVREGVLRVSGEMGRTDPGVGCHEREGGHKRREANRRPAFRLGLDGDRRGEYVGICSADARDAVAGPIYSVGQQTAGPADNRASGRPKRGYDLLWTTALSFSFVRGMQVTPSKPSSKAAKQLQRLRCSLPPRPGGCLPGSPSGRVSQSQIKSLISRRSSRRPTGKLPPSHLPRPGQETTNRPPPSLFCSLCGN